MRTISLEFTEGYEAYAEGIEGYTAKPYTELSQELADWFAGWLSARDDERAEECSNPTWGA